MFQPHAAVTRLEVWFDADAEALKGAVRQLLRRQAIARVQDEWPLRPGLLHGFDCTPACGDEVSDCFRWR